MRKIVSLVLCVALLVAQLPHADAGGFGPAQGGGGAGGVTSAALDSLLGSTRGSLAERGAGGWTILAPGATAGNVLASNGAGADPSYQASPWTLTSGLISPTTATNTLVVGSASTAGNAQAAWLSINGSTTSNTPIYLQNSSAADSRGLAIAVAADTNLRTLLTEQSLSWDTGASGTLRTGVRRDVSGNLSLFAQVGVILGAVTSFPSSLGPVFQFTGPPDQALALRSGAAGKNIVAYCNRFQVGTQAGSLSGASMSTQTAYFTDDGGTSGNVAFGTTIGGVDVGLARPAAGVLELNSGTPGTVTGQFKLPGTTGAATVSTMTNSPATITTNPYTWLEFKAADGTQVYVPAWK